MPRRAHNQFLGDSPHLFRVLKRDVFWGEENPRISGGTYRRPQSAPGLQFKDSFVDRPLALTGREDWKRQRSWSTYVLAVFPDSKNGKMNERPIGEGLFRRPQPEPSVPRWHKENTMETTQALVRCPRCQRNLDPICFYKDRSKSSGRKSHCRNCTKTACRKWKRENPEKVAAYKSEERRERRELRLRNRELRDLYSAQSDAADYQQMVDLFGPDCQSKGIHLANKRSTKLSSKPLNLLAELEELHWLLADEFNGRYRNHIEMTKAALMLRLFNSLFPMS